MPRQDLVVIGAGIIGVSTAYALARRGHRVAIVDRAEGPAFGASYANGAQLSYANTDALASSALLKRIPKLVLGRDPSFKVNSTFDPDFLKWAIEFLRNCSESRFRDNTSSGLLLAMESRLAMQKLLEAHPIEFGNAVPGKLHLYFDERAFAAAREVAKIKRANGFPQDELTRTEAASIEPLVLSRENVVGAIYSPMDEVGDAFKFSKALLDILASEYGVTTRFNYEVDKIELDSHGVMLSNSAGEVVRGSQIIVCAGIDSVGLLKKVGARCALWPMKGYSLTAPLGEQAPRVSVTDTSKRIVFCPLSWKLRVAGLAELGQWNTQVTEARSKLLIEMAREAFPYAGAYDRIESVWAGVRAMTPSTLPILSRVRPKVLVNSGHGMLGWTYAMGSAERVAEIVALSE
jgi:D-amino-acid dehydrogenase